MTDLTLLFRNPTTRIWYQKENVHQFLTHIRQQLMINRAPEDWYRVSEKLVSFNRLMDCLILIFSLLSLVEVD